MKHFVVTRTYIVLIDEQVTLPQWQQRLWPDQEEVGRDPVSNAPEDIRSYHEVADNMVDVAYGDAEHPFQEIAARLVAQIACRVEEKRDD